jgi:hypothetical protein
LTRTKGLPLLRQLIGKVRLELFAPLAVVDKRDKEFDLVLLKQFELGTEYGSVLGYLKLLNENLHDLRRIMIDQTGVGETFIWPSARD